MKPFGKLFLSVALMLALPQFVRAAAFDVRVQQRDSGGTLRNKDISATADALLGFNTSKEPISMLPATVLTLLGLSTSDTPQFAGLILPHGAAPGSPTNGQIWTTTAGIFVRVNGVTIGPLGTGGGGGSGAWGGITGTLGDQTDLQTELDAKQPKNPTQTALSGGTTITLGTDYVDTFGADRSLTISGTTDGSHSQLTAVVSTAITLTITASYRNGASSTTTSVPIAAAGRYVLFWQYKNGALYLDDNAGGISELATASPSSGDHVPIQTSSGDKRATIADLLALASATYEPLRTTVSQANAEAGTSTTAYAWTPQRVGQAIAALSGGGTGIPTNGIILWPTASLGSMPAGFLEADGTEGTVDLSAASTSLSVATYIQKTSGVAPTLSSATIGTDGTTFTMVFSEAVSFGSGDIGDFALTMSGGAVAIDAYDSGTGTNTIITTLDRTVIDTETGTLAYTQPGDGVEDGINLDLASFAGTSITNSSTQTGGGGGAAFVAGTSDGLGPNGGASSAINTTGANLLVVVASWYAGSTTSVTVSDSKSNTWTDLTPQEDSAGGTGSRVRISYCYGGTVGSGHTFSLSGINTYCTITVFAFSGSSSSPFDQENGTGASGWTTLQPGSITPSQANTIVVTGLAYDNAASTITINGGYSSNIDYTDTASGNNIGGGASYVILSAATAQNPTWSSSATETYGATAIASFKY